jgi:hypothetical protein
LNSHIYGAGGLVRYVARYITVNRRDFSSMIEKTPRARGMSEKELRARIDRVIAEEERTYGRLIELRECSTPSPASSIARRPACRTLEHCCHAIAVSPEQAIITPLCAAAHLLTRDEPRRITVKLRLQASAHMPRADSVEAAGAFFETGRIGGLAKGNAGHCRLLALTDCH